MGMTAKDLHFATDLLQSFHISVSKDCRLFQSVFAAHELHQNLELVTSINTKLLDTHPSGFMYMKIISATFLKIARQKGKPLEDVRGSMHRIDSPG